jgi:hypothetical protein
VGFDSSSCTDGLEHTEAVYSHHMSLETVKTDPLLTPKPFIIIIMLRVTGNEVRLITKTSEAVFFLQI